MKLLLVPVSTGLLDKLPLDKLLLDKLLLDKLPLDKLLDELFGAPPPQANKPHNMLPNNKPSDKYIIEACKKEKIITKKPNFYCDVNLDYTLLLI
jgi:hypothetical protein